MRWLFLVLFLCAFTPVYNNHRTLDQVDTEINQIESEVQDKSFTIVTTTPNLSELRDGEIVIFGSTLTTTVKLMFRQGQELYTVQTSCITVKR